MLDSTGESQTPRFRINPGNVGKGDKHDRQFGQMIDAAVRWNKAVRIGVNWGSLDQELLASLMDENNARAVPWDAKQVMYEALITSAVGSAQLAEKMGLSSQQIILSCKVSGVQDLISVYRELAKRSRYALHLADTMMTETGILNFNKPFYFSFYLYLPFEESNRSVKRKNV